MQHDWNPLTKTCRRCFRKKLEVVINDIPCEPSREWTPELTDALAAAYNHVVRGDDTTPTPVIVEPPPCSEATSPAFGP